MFSCDDAQRLMARAADSSTGDERFDAHLASCEACRAMLDGQRQIARMLRERDAAGAVPGFASRLSARLDGESADGFFDVIDWRTWTVGLAPMAAAFMLAAYLGVGAGTTVETADTTAAAETSLDVWGGSGDGRAAVLLQPASGDVLLETVLTGAAPYSSTGEIDVR